MEVAKAIRGVDNVRDENDQVEIVTPVPANSVLPDTDVVPSGRASPIRSA